MKKKRKYIYLEKCLIICILQICIFSFYDFLFFISLSDWERYATSVGYISSDGTHIIEEIGAEDFYEIPLHDGHSQGN